LNRSASDGGFSVGGAGGGGAGAGGGGVVVGAGFSTGGGCGAGATFFLPHALTASEATSIVTAIVRNLDIITVISSE
jgi:hypothetical protein